eukprot:GFYU01003290.1.p1 GENE.GFYU01003290.1~~GFYU01003290.1.p1  ORF type:complete len:290 (-),score=44.59 GFYU01003290.1:178-1011(-)
MTSTTTHEHFKSIVAEWSSQGTYSVVLDLSLGGVPDSTDTSTTMATRSLDVTAPNVTELLVTNCAVSCVPENVLLALPNLAKLIIQDDTCETFPSVETLKQLPSLTVIEFFGKGLKSLPSNIGELQMLKELAVCCTSIATLPVSLSQCRGLTRLDVSDNPLMKSPLPATLLSLQQHVQDLMLNNLPLESCDVSFPDEDADMALSDLPAVTESDKSCFECGNSNTEQLRTLVMTKTLSTTSPSESSNPSYDLPFALEVCSQVCLNHLLDQTVNHKYSK